MKGDKMHPLFSQQLARLHMQDLQREVEAARSAALLNKAESTRSHHFYLRWFRLWQDRTRFLSTPTVVRERYPERINFEEIKPALVSTFSTMHDTGLVSEYDEQFVEKFVQAFERELAHQSACKCS
jgi:hypothetical protein